MDVVPELLQNLLRTGAFDDENLLHLVLQHVTGVADVLGRLWKTEDMYRLLQEARDTTTPPYR